MFAVNIAQCDYPGIVVIEEILPNADDGTKYGKPTAPTAAPAAF
jgi:hypothetical protein